MPHLIFTKGEIPADEDFGTNDAIDKLYHGMIAFGENYSNTYDPDDAGRTITQAITDTLAMPPALTYHLYRFDETKGTHGEFVELHDPTCHPNSQNPNPTPTPANPPWKIKFSGTPFFLDIQPDSQSSKSPKMVIAAPTSNDFQYLDIFARSVSREVVSSMGTGRNFLAASVLISRCR